MTIIEYIENNGSITYRFRGVSMLPMLKQGKDLVTIEKPEGRLRKYDVALYRKGEKLVLHRVVQVLQDSYVILGDNCMSKEYGIRDDQIIGVLKSFSRGSNTYKPDSALLHFYAVIWYAVFPVRRVFMKLRSFAGRIYHAVIRDRK